jgi:2-polyprenyl-3-methyl-5-hydroxy-6-metoxy-1,4-benzoquinol methylase
MSKITNAENIKLWSSAPSNILDSFGDEGDFARQYLLNPVLFTLLGDIKNKKILDAGCGQGYLSRLMAKKGAKVTGIDPAHDFIQYAINHESQEKLGITYLEEDLAKYKQSRGEFDFIVSNMVFMDIPDYQTAIHNCIQSLKNGGYFIFSISHPCFFPDSEWDKNPVVEIREYFQEYSEKQNFGYSFHRTLSSYLNLVINEGCEIKQLIEPKLDEKTARLKANYLRQAHVPSFLIVQTRKK